MAYKLPALMFALAACGTVDNTDPMDDAPDQPTTDDPSTPSTEDTEFRYFTALEDGTPKNTFDAVGDAYLNAGGNLHVAPGDYYFTVSYDVCQPGSGAQAFVPQLGPIGCRTFSVGSNGRITQGTPVELGGTSCGRATGIDAAGSITVGIMPFEQSTRLCSPYAVHVIPVGGAEAVATLYFNAPAPEEEPPSGPVCGNGIVEDGEGCDDGNEADHDGCSGLCVIEPDCHPTQL